MQCGECKKLFNNAWFLHQHGLRVHAGEKPQQQLLCPKEGCGKRFTRPFNLESHVLGDHEGKKPFSCVYAGCGKSFAMKVNFAFFDKANWWGTFTAMAYLSIVRGIQRAPMTLYCSPNTAAGEYI